MLPSELVICDDGSVDSTPEIVADFVRSAPFKVRFVQNPANLGSTKNFEQAINLCTGEFIALCDQDDVWYLNKLARLLTVLASDSSIGGVFSDGDLINELSQPIGKHLWEVFGFTEKYQRWFAQSDPAAVLCKRGVVTGATMMFRAGLRSALLPIPNSWIHDGWFAWMLVLQSRLTFTHERLIGYRVHRNQQAGVPAITFSDRLSRSRAEENRASTRTAQQFEDLKSHLEETPNKLPQAFLEDILGVIHHSRARANLSRKFLVRSMYVLSHARYYNKYSNGLRTMLKDMVLS
jgi:glycosyltransferase involved in cell wall biosynthesis